MPSIPPASVMSIRMTSGLLSWARSTASCPLPASPTTSKPSAQESSARIPLRTHGMVVTIKTRTLDLADRVAVSVIASPQPSPRASPGRAYRTSVGPADACRAFGAVRQAAPPFRRAPLADRTQTVIQHFQADGLGPVEVQMDGHMPGDRCLRTLLRASWRSGRAPLRSRWATAAPLDAELDFARRRGLDGRQDAPATRHQPFRLQHRRCSWKMTAMSRMPSARSPATPAGSRP